MEELTGVVLQATLSILSVLLMTAVQKFKKWLEAKAGLEGVKTVEIVANNAVRAVEQIYRDQDIHGKQKFERAVDKALDTLHANGINVSLMELHTAIESAVKAMNDGWNGQHEK